MSDRILQTAFPLVYDDVTKSSREVHLGMSLRDYFAAQALEGFLSFGSLAQAIQSRISDVTFTGDPVAVGREDLAEGCYAMADAMLKARQS